MRRAFVVGLMLLGVAPAAYAGPAETRLLAAVRDGNHAAIKAALAAKANVNAPLPDKSTVLDWAVDRQDAESVRLLLASGAQPRAAAGAVQPLSLACELGNGAIVSALLKAGADAREIRADGTTAFALCAGTATPEILASMRAKGANVNSLNAQNQTPLMWAAMAGNTNAIKWLLANGAKVNAADKKGFTPVFFALRSKVSSASMALLDAGADINAAVADGTTVVQAAITTRNIPFAIQAVNHGADLHRADRNGRQMIHLAAQSGDADFVKIVLSKGGDPNAVAGAPQAPLRVAAAAPPPAAAAAGAADPAAAAAAAAARAAAARANFLPPAPSTPLQLAARAGSVAAMKALVDAGAKPDQKGADGMTVAMAAAGSGDVAAMAYAYQVDPHLDVIARGGRSIMHIAVAASGTPDPIGVIQYLVDKGAPLAIEDSRKDTPGDMLSRGGDPVIREFYIKLLRDRGIVSTNH